MSDSRPSSDAKASAGRKRRAPRDAGQAAAARAVEGLAHKPPQAGRGAAKLHDIIENTWDFIFEIDPTGAFTFANRAAERILGFTADELIGATFAQLVTEEYQELIAERLAKRVSGEAVPQPLELEALHRDGHRVRLEITTHESREDGRLVSVQGIARDISARRLAEGKLRKAEEEQRQLCELLTGLQEVINELSMAESVEELCRKAVELGRIRLGFDRLSLWFAGDGPRSVVGSFGVDEQGRIRDERGERKTIAPGSKIASLLSDKTRLVVDREARLSRLSDKPLVRGSRVLAALWDGRRVLGYLAADNLLGHRELTDAHCDLLRLYASSLGHLCARQRYEEAIREGEQRLRLILDNSTDGISMTEVGPEGELRLVMCNDRLVEMSGRTREELMAARDLREFLEGLSRREAPTARASPGEGYEPVQGRSSWIRPDGRKNQFEWTAATIRREGRAYVVGISRDVTERARAEGALRSKRREERAFRAELMQLNEVTNELSMSPSLEDLCRRAVELGRSKLGFGRLGLWFTTSDPWLMAGSFGVDEEGRIRDERREIVTVASDDIVHRILTRKIPVALAEDILLTDYEGRPIRRSVQAVTGLWDGEKMIGYLVTDNLLDGADIGERRCDLLRLYASSLGHLASRKRAEEALRRSEASERSFRTQLTALHEVSNRLSMTASVDELCRKAVECGRSELGFDRMSIWLATRDRRTMLGTFGVDEQGNIRDERSMPLRITDKSPLNLVLGGERSLVTREDCPLRNHRGELIGRGTLVCSALWDGKEVIGCLIADNYSTGDDITANRCELLRLYASSIGHLCSRKRQDEALRKSEETERSFRADLTVLLEVTNDLSMARSFDELCRRAVELGRDKLDFDRPSIWLGTEDELVMAGTFGVDEKGRIRDERGNRTVVAPGSLVHSVLSRRIEVAVSPDIVIAGENGEPSGRASRAVTGLWDGRKIIGYVSVDNLLTHREITRNRQELLRLYASSLGHLCSRKRAEDALREAHHKLMTAAEAERKRLAGELHDGIGQKLVAMQLALRSIAPDDRPPAKPLKHTWNLADSLIRGVRGICYGLYPPTLESMGLEIALQQLTRDLQSQTQVAVDISRRCRGMRFSPDVEIALFRIAQEAVSNAVRHGQARRIDVGLGFAKGTVSLTVVNDGKAFDPSAAKGKGLGLTLMAERAEAIGGQLQIDSDPGRTAVSVRAPVDAPSDRAAASERQP